MKIVGGTLNWYPPLFDLNPSNLYNNVKTLVIWREKYGTALVVKNRIVNW